MTRKDMQKSSKLPTSHLWKKRVASSWNWGSKWSETLPVRQVQQVPPHHLALLFFCLSRSALSCSKSDLTCHTAGRRGSSLLPGRQQAYLKEPRVSSTKAYIQNKARLIPQKSGWQVPLSLPCLLVYTLQRVTLPLQVPG